MMRIEILETRQMLAFDWQNGTLIADVDDSWFVSPIDALVVINQLNRVGSGVLPVRDANSTEPYYDVNGDGYLSPNDVLLFINALNQSRDPMGLVAGISPASDTNGNGVVLTSHVILNAQSLTGVALHMKPLDSTDPAVHAVTDENGEFTVHMPLEHGSKSCKKSVEAMSVQA